MCSLLVKDPRSDIKIPELRGDRKREKFWGNKKRWNEIQTKKINRVFKKKYKLDLLKKGELDL